MYFQEMTEMTESEERFNEPTADRPPTEEEAAAAEKAAADVDVDEVAEHYEEMTEKGKEVEGEGRIGA